MQRIEKAIDVDVPLRMAYDQWTQFEDFPRYMMNVHSVRQLDATHLQWEAEIGGRRVSWTAEITQQEPDRLIAWRSTSGLPTAGSVSFLPVSPSRTRVLLSLDYEPEDALQSAGAALGLVERRVEHDLEKFKEFIEGSGRATGAWRGRVQPGDQAGT